MWALALLIFDSMWPLKKNYIHMKCLQQMKQLMFLIPGQSGLFCMKVR